MYSCKEVLAELAAYLDDEVALEVRKELEGHLSHCHTCRTLYDSTRKTLRIVTESGSFELPENISTQIVEKIMGRVRAGRKRPRRKGSDSSSKPR